MPKQVPAQSEAKDSAKQVKRLRKREQRLLERLEEAQKRYESAQARLQRAEVRVQKRRGRVERLDGRLALLREQLQTVIDSAEATISDLSMVENISAESTEKEGAVVAGSEQLEEVYSEYEEIVSAATPVDAPQLGAQPVSAEDQELVSQVEEEHRIGNVNEEELEMVEVMPVELPEHIVLPPSSEETVTQTEEDQQRSIAFARQKAVLVSEARAVAENAEQAAQVATVRTNYMLDHLEQMLDNRYLNHELEQLQIESAILTSLRRDARHTVDRLTQLSAQDDQEETFALLTREIERQRQQLAQVRTSIDFSAFSGESAEPTSEGNVVEDKDTEYADFLAALGPGEEEIHFDIPASAFIHPVTEQGTAQESLAEMVDSTVPAPPFSLATIEQAILEQPSSPQEEAVTSVLPSSEEQQLSHLDEEEKEVEMVAAMVVADVAAAAAAEAEALAAACRIRTQNAYAAAVQTDRALEQLQSAIQNGVFTGDEAQAAFQLAERASTEAHADLADAEAAEEEAISAAINAEAEAEVAEGMAFAAHERDEQRVPEVEGSSVRGRV